MQLAIETSAAAVRSSTPNPPVGAVILDSEHRVAGVGFTQPPGGPHAEVMALRAAGERARGGTAVVTLEPCDHTGRTGPCTQALIAAGISRVHYGVSDPNPLAAGGASTLADSGISVHGGRLRDQVETGPLRAWLFRQTHARPLVIGKLAATIDGRIAAPDGTSQWITGPVARAHAHAERAELDAIVVGTGTALTDDPALTARRADGTLYPHQPQRIVLGHRDLPADAALFGGPRPAIQVRSHRPVDALTAAGNALRVLVEGGPRILGAFLAADLLDELHVYSAPVLLGAGAAAINADQITTLAQARRLRRESVTELGEDLLIVFTAS